MERKSVRSLDRILVGVVAREQVDAPFAETFSGALVGHGSMFLADQMWMIGGVTDHARNTIAAKAVEGNYDYVFFMDSDMTFPVATLASLYSTLNDRKVIESADMKINVIGGVYNSRSSGHRIQAYNYVVNPDIGFQPLTDVELNGDIIPCDCVATGCLLINTSVFREMEFPYFEYKYQKRSNNEKPQRWSEDMVFAEKCVNSGIPHFLHTGVICGHIHVANIYQVGKDTYEIQALNQEVYGQYNNELVSEVRRNGRDKK